jgi:hypothetical protein
VILNDAGEIGPIFTLSSDARAEIAPVAIWDGTRFVVFWSVMQSGVSMTQYSEITAQGASLGVKTLPNVPAVANATSNNGSIAIVWSVIGPFTSTTNIGVLSGDAVAPVLVSTHFGTEVLGRTERDESIAWIGNQFFVSWVSARLGTRTGVLGTRVTAAGVPLDYAPSTGTPAGKVVYYEYSQATSTNLRSFAAGSKYVLAWRAGNREFAANVDLDGNFNEPATIMSVKDEVLQSSDVARLPDGRFAIAYELGRSHRVELQITGSGSKRRAVQ